MATEKLSPVQQRAVDWIKGSKATELGALGTEVGRMLAELTTEQLDARREAAHWKQAYDAIRAELKVLAAIAIKKTGVSRLVITRKDLLELPPDTQLHVQSPDEYTRIYELRREETPDGATRQ